MADWVEVRALSNHAFGNYVEQSLESYENILSEDAFDALVDTREKRLVQTMRSRLVRDLARHLNEPSLRGLSLRAMKSESESNSATVAVIGEGVSKASRSISTRQRTAGALRASLLKVETWEIITAT